MKYSRVPLAHIYWAAFLEIHPAAFLHDGHFHFFPPIGSNCHGQYPLALDSIPYFLRILPDTALVNICFCLWLVAAAALNFSCLSTHAEYTKRLRISLATFLPLSNWFTFFLGLGDTEVFCCILCNLFLHLSACLFAASSFISNCFSRT